jgi:thiopurine S-methyltransferase
MEAEFWHERWEKGQIAFHKHEYNNHMQAFINHLKLQPGDHILVPLCGKSLDMLWLLNQGYHVTGIEISSLAVEDFFAENNLQSQVIKSDNAQLYTSKNLKIYCADFFTVELTQTPRIDAVYDRASLIALPQEMRVTYVDRISQLIPARTRSLLVTLDYPQQEMAGPPFSVTPEEVEQLYGTRYSIERIHSEDCLKDEPQFRAKGLSKLDEHIFLLQKNPADL